jgi:hypothetical protein
MLAGAEADLQPDVVHPRRKQGAGIEQGAGRRQRYRQPRQQLLDQPPAAVAEAPALAPTIEALAFAIAAVAPVAPVALAGLLLGQGLSGR